MVDQALLKLIMAIAIPIAGSMGYMHGNFATKTRVEKTEKTLGRVDKLICKMAIRQKLENAEDICTEH